MGPGEWNQRDMLARTIESGTLLPNATYFWSCLPVCTGEIAKRTVEIAKNHMLHTIICSVANQNTVYGEDASPSIYIQEIK